MPTTNNIYGVGEKKNTINPAPEAGFGSVKNHGESIINHVPKNAATNERTAIAATKSGDKYFVFCVFDDGLAIVVSSAYQTTITM